MTLSEIVTICMQENGSRFQLQEAQVLSFADLIQKMAFGRDMDAFVVRGAFPVYRGLSFLSSGLTPAVASDVGKVVTGGTSGATATLISSVGTSWVVSPLNGLAFTNGEAITIASGTGAGDLAASGAQSVHQGPYDFPTSPPCRKVLGVTKVTDAQIFGRQQAYFDTSSFPQSDYGAQLASYDERRMYEIGWVNAVDRTFSFVEDPSVAASTYRWVYYRRAPTLSTADAASLVIPEEFHHTLLVQGIVALADNAVYGDKAPQALLEPYLAPYWEHLLETVSQADATLGFSEGQP